MGANSKIEWCDHTFNPWTGCEKVSAGCAHCYAESWAKRTNIVKWGAAGTRRRTTDENWKKPHGWNFDAAKEGVRKRVFCASLADVFEDREELKPWRVELFELFEQTPWLDWLLLTKRPENAAPFLQGFYGRLGCAPWKNIWLGTSVENQEAANERIPHLLHAPAAVRFLSCEPLLGALDLCGYIPCPATAATLYHPFVNPLRGWYSAREQGRGTGCSGPGIDWVIVGGESGPGARACDVIDVLSIVRQCRAAGVAPFVKQLGAMPWMGYTLDLNDKKGGDWNEWPEGLDDLRVREFPTVAGV